MRLSRWRRYAPDLPTEIVPAPSPEPPEPPGISWPPALRDVIAGAIADQRLQIEELRLLVGPLPPGLRLEVGALRAVEIDRSSPAVWRVRFEQDVRLVQKPVEP